MNTIQPSVLPFYTKDHHLWPLPNNMFLVFTQDLIRMTFTTTLLRKFCLGLCVQDAHVLYLSSLLWVLTRITQSSTSTFPALLVPCESHFPISRLLLQQYPVSLYQLLSYSAATIAKYHCLGGSATDTISNSPGVKKLPNHYYDDHVPQYNLETKS